MYYMKFNSDDCSRNILCLCLHCMPKRRIEHRSVNCFGKKESCMLFVAIFTLSIVPPQLSDGLSFKAKLICLGLIIYT